MSDPGDLLPPRQEKALRIIASECEEKGGPVSAHETKTYSREREGLYKRGMIRLVRGVSFELTGLGRAWIETFGRG